VDPSPAIERLLLTVPIAIGPARTPALVLPSIHLSREISSRRRGVRVSHVWPADGAG
jgi:hypothetical protein